ncbi:MAG: sensor histidine kinase [Chloroflexaceae bacterium]
MAFALALLLAVGWMGAPATDVRDLMLYLGLSTMLSLVLVLPTLRWLRAGGGRLLHKLTLTYMLGMVIAAFTIILTARLMFISPHDRQLLLLLLAFTAVVALALGIVLANLLSANITRLRDGAHRLAAGQLDTRVELSGGDELADLARDFNQLAAQLAAAAQERSQLEEARRELFAAISHDLRTPLASLRAMTEALDDGLVSDPAMTQRYLATMRSQIGILNSLIDDLFELARLEAGAVHLERERTALQDLVSDTLEGMRAEANQRGVDLSGVVAAEVGPVLVAPQKIERVLANLVLNALAHTPAGGRVTITVRHVLPDEQPTSESGEADLLVEVADTGEGIDPADLPHIFERFYRGEKSRSRRTGGTGLGLAIARGIVAAHGGQIWITSRPGSGTRVRFTLPGEYNLLER